MLTSDLTTSVLQGLSEPEGVYNSSTEVQRHLSAAETLLTLARALNVKSANFQPVSGAAVHPVQAQLSDYMLPLGFSLNHKQLFSTTLSAVSRENSSWQQQPGVPKTWFALGVTLLGFVPRAPSVPILSTYVAQPPTLVGATAPIIAEMWHEALIDYALAVLSAKEGEIEHAVEHLEEFAVKAGFSVQEIRRMMRLAGLLREPRLASGEVRGSAAEQPLRPSIMPERG